MMIALRLPPDLARPPRRCLPTWLAAVAGCLALFVASASAAAPLSFDGQRAYDDVVRQCGFGPRNPNSAGHARCLAFLEAELRTTASDVRRQGFTYDLPGARRERLNLTNLVATFNPDNPHRVLLCAHWDTRPWADMDPDSTRRGQPIPGANDGASGVAVLLELARIMKAAPPALGVDLVLFDGEDLGTKANPDGFFRGSKEYVRSLGPRRPDRGILLDMVGDKDLLFEMEGYSAEGAPGTVEWIWDAARDVAPAYFSGNIGYYVVDDHIPLIGAGIQCADLIDFKYSAWHTLADTPDKVSPVSLQVVGDLLVRLLYPQ